MKRQKRMTKREKKAAAKVAEAMIDSMRVAYTRAWFKSPFYDPKLGVKL